MFGAGFPVLLGLVAIVALSQDVEATTGPYENDEGERCEAALPETRSQAVLLQIEVSGDSAGSLRHVSPDTHHPWRRHRETAAIVAIQDGDDSTFTHDDRKVAAKIGRLHEELESLWQDSSMAAGATKQTKAWMSVVSTKARLDSVYAAVRTQLEDLHRQVVASQEQLEKQKDHEAQQAVKEEISKMKARAQGLTSLLIGERQQESLGGPSGDGGTIGVEKEDTAASSQDKLLVKKLHNRHLQLERLWQHLLEPQPSTVAQSAQWTSFVEAKMALDTSYAETRSRYEELYRMIIVLREKEKSVKDEDERQRLQAEVHALKLRAHAMREAAMRAEAM